MVRPIGTTNEETSALPITSNVYHPIHNEEEEVNGTGAEITRKGISVTWKNLKVVVDIKTHHILRNATHTYKEIIHDVNGYVEPSSFVAILGASGSGKSTLMSALANRQSGDLKVTGDVRMNGKRIHLKSMKKISGFVYQEDLFNPKLTVLEHLHFTAQIKLDKNITFQQREKLINELITEVGLKKCAKNFIGSSHFGNEKVNISGGERKRLSVATELLTNPPLLFCDEPTTGLDSFTALKLVTTMRNMTSQRATTIICSVHQPNEQIFNLFHHIILLYEGKTAFSGTIEEAVEFFRSIGYPFNEEQNPAHCLIENISVVPGHEMETSTKASNICEEFKNSRYAKIINNLIDKEESKTTDRDFDFINKNKRISWFYALYLMTYREILGIMRDPSAQYVQFSKSVLSATLIGICLMGSTTMTQNGIQALKGVIFYMVSECWVGAVYAVISHFPNQMPMFLREYTNDVNSPAIFYLSNVISLIPSLALSPIFNITLIYCLVGLRNSWTALLWTVFCCIQTNITSAVLGIWISLSTNRLQTASVIFYPISIVYLMYFGIYFNLRSIPWTLYWIRYTSWITYTTEILFALQLDGVEHIQCSQIPNVPCLKNGKEVMKYLDFDGNNFTRNIITICIITCIFLMLGYLTLKIRLHSRLKT